MCALSAESIPSDLVRNLPFEGNPMKKIKESPFENAYGGLSLVVEETTGKRYLDMDGADGSGGTFGPLTDEQVAAFFLLCEVPEISA